MNCGWAERLAALALALAGLAAPLPAQQVREIGVQAIATAADPATGVLGVSGALRTSSRARVAAFLGAGIAGDRGIWRGELVGHFLLNPAARGRPGLYGGGGIAVVGSRKTRGYAVLLLGIEGNPGGSSGWNFEAGVGGGVRLSVGYRWRSIPSL
ncbi:MAG TPA: hypothetical protein VFL95_05670 [Gemmatimonadales bacterium]|jgi:hypothetical protein|nr:hypothetical protein [Gemmatimonadales bacterium]